MNWFGFILSLVGICYLQEVSSNIYRVTLYTFFFLLNETYVQSGCCAV